MNFINCNDYSDIVFIGSLKYYLFDMFSLSWEVTPHCNYKCYYCGLSDNLMPDPEYKYEKFLSFIKTVQCKDMDLCFTGGEFTIDKQFPNFLKDLIPILKDKNVCIKFMTNLSQDKDYYINLLNIVSNYKIIFAITYHTCYDKNIDLFIDKCKLIKETYTNVLLDIRVPITIDEFSKSKDNYYKIKHELENKGVVDVTPKYIFIEGRQVLEPDQKIWFDKEIYKQRSNKYNVSINTSVIYYNVDGELKHEIITREQLRYLDYMNIKWVCDAPRYAVKFFSTGKIGYCQVQRADISYDLDFDSQLPKSFVCQEKICACGHSIPKINLKHYAKFLKVSEEWLHEIYNEAYL